MSLRTVPSVQCPRQSTGRILHCFPWITYPNILDGFGSQVSSVVDHILRQVALFLFVLVLCTLISWLAFLGAHSTEAEVPLHEVQTH